MLTSKITLSIVAALSSTLDLTSPEADVTKSYVVNSRTAPAPTRRRRFSPTAARSAAASTDNLDLSGTLVDALGATVALTGVKELIIVNTGTTQLRIGKKITNGFAGPVRSDGGLARQIVEAGGVLRLSNPSAAGWTVTAATADQLSVENLTASAGAYDVIIIGK
jgi:hypothetical protein